MKIHVVTAQGEGWIMPKYANALVKHGENISHSHTIRNDVDVNLFLPYYNFNNSTRTYTVCYFTHREEHPQFEHRRQQWKNAARSCDFRLSMSIKYAELLKPHGPTEVLMLPVLESQVGKLVPKKYRIGISTRHYPSDRKGTRLIEKLKKSELMEYIELVETNGKISKDKMSAWYRSLDYYLCTSSVEGGPLGVLEAELSNIRAIAPSDVGWCDQVASYTYQKNNFEELQQVLMYLVLPSRPLKRHNEKAWTRDLVEAIKRQRQ